MLLSYIRDFVPPFYLGLAVCLLRAAGTRMPWHPVPSRAASVYLRYGFLDLQSADFFRFFIRNLRYSFDLLSGFTRDEYHVIRVDFIVALRRTKGRGRRTLRSPPSPSSGLHLIHPGCPLRRGISAAAVYTNLGSGIPVLSLLPSPECCTAICVRAGIARVSVGLLGLCRTFFIIGGGIVRACGYVGFCYVLS